MKTIDSFSQLMSPRCSRATSPARTPYTASTIRIARSRIEEGVLLSILPRSLWTSDHDGADGKDSCLKTRGAMMDAAMPSLHHPRVSANRKNERREDA